MSDDIILARRMRDALPVFIAVASLGLALLIASMLYLGRDVLVPIALAILLSFVLAPLVRLLQKIRLLRSLAVLSAVIVAALSLFMLGTVVFGQVAQLAADLPRYQTNMQDKIRSIRAMSADSGAFGRAFDVLQNLGEQLQAPVPGNDKPTSGDESALATDVKTPRPVPVEVREAGSGPLTTITTVLSPLLHPLASIGLVLIFAIFILIQREDLRNRFIRLAGNDDLQRTTAAIDDAASRLSRLFLTQLGLNAGFGVVIGIGLWIIGVPSPALWGILAGALRFVPYVGAVISAVLPLGLAVAVDPGWSMLLWTALLFIVIEPIVGHAIEPLVYGHSTGLSPIAVIVAATLWTFLWGPIGLVLATPLTVCLVVLGRHVERLKFLDILLGDRPALSPRQIFYQRMLAGDPDEAVEQARDFLKERALATYYDEVALEGLRLAQEDIARGSITSAREDVLKHSINRLVEDLATIEGPLPSHRGSVGAEAAAAVETIGPDRDIASLVRSRDDMHPDWRGSTPVLVVAGQGALDQAVASMLGQLFTKHGLATRVVTHEAITQDPPPFGQDDGIALICFSYLDALSTVHIRYAARRLRRSVPGRQNVMVGLWRQRDPSTLETLRRATSAQVLVTSLHQALTAAIDMSGKPVEAAPRSHVAIAERRLS